MLNFRLNPNFARHIFIFAAAACLTISVACGEGDDHGENDDNGDHDLSAEEEACLHASEDTPIPREATLDMNDASGDISASHVHYQIDLVENTDEDFEGYLTFDVDESGDFNIFTSIDVELSLVDSDEQEAAVESSSVDECVEIAQRHAVTLDAGEHFVHFGPTTENQLFVVSEASHDTD